MNGEPNSVKDTKTEMERRVKNLSKTLNFSEVVSLNLAPTPMAVIFYQVSSSPKNDPRGKVKV